VDCVDRSANSVARVGDRRTSGYTCAARPPEYPSDRVPVVSA
jgi:hypothetical protein